MRSRCTVAALVLALVLAAAGAGCGSRHVATTTTRSLPRFNPGAVTRAFASVGIRLHNPDPTGSAPHFFTSVTMLTGIRLPEGWTLAAYIYPTPNQANASFSQDAGGWSASGIASVQVKNVVVIVIPRGHTLTHKARPFPMPALVYTALHLLTRTA